MTPTVDKLTLTVLADGTAKIEANAGISKRNHLAADRIFTLFTKLMGGRFTDEKLKKGHTHTHAHTHDTQKTGN